jgi:site-specific recombinase XerD
MGHRKIWIGELRYRVEASMRNDLKMNDSAINHLSSGFKLIEKYLIEFNDGFYSPEAVDKFVDEKIDAYHQGNFDHRRLSVLRKANMYLNQYYNNGKIEYFNLPTLGRTNLNNFFEDVVSQYEKIEQQRHVLSPNVIEARKKVISRFLYFLQCKGHETFDSVKPDDIRSYLFELSQKQPRGIIYTLPIIRKFCAMLNDNNIYIQNWEYILNVKPAAHKIVRTPFTSQQIEKILQAPDKKTPIGMRDLAMMLLAVRTGLRSIDIINLKFSEIDWRSNEITIVQHKTGKALSLPLFADVGNAISEYILKARPESDSEYIFLSTRPPFRKMSDHANSIVQRNLKKAGLTYNSKLRKGFHSFRRSVGTQMLESNIPLPTIATPINY